MRIAYGDAKLGFRRAFRFSGDTTVRSALDEISAKMKVRDKLPIKRTLYRLKLTIAWGVLLNLLRQ